MTSLPLTDFLQNGGVADKGTQDFASILPLIQGSFVDKYEIMKTLALVFILMVALSVQLAHGRRSRRRFKISEESQHAMKKWIVYYMDKQLDRFQRWTHRKFKLTPTQVKVLRYMNRDKMMRNCRSYRRLALLILMRRGFPLSKKFFGAAGRYIGHRVRMWRVYYRMASKKKIPKLTKLMKEVLAKKPGDLPC